MKIVQVWRRGYAAQDGLVSLTIADDADPATAARAVFGPCAAVFSVRPQIRRPAEPVSEAYARMMSRNDNS
jgi:hypothetical protein